jgi:hypothetical protein
MDPDEALKELRALVQVWAPMSEDHTIYDSEGDHHLDRLFKLFIGLDEWLSSGGYVPMAWKVNR